MLFESAAIRGEFPLSDSIHNLLMILLLMIR